MDFYLCGRPPLAELTLELEYFSVLYEDEDPEWVVVLRGDLVEVESEELMWRVMSRSRSDKVERLLSPEEKLPV